MSKKNTTKRHIQSDEDGSGQFERFQDLTRRLLAVPKKEADAKRRESKGQKDNRTR